MKKYMTLLAAVVAAVSLAACTPTTEKNASTAGTPTSEAFKADTMEERNKGNENLPVQAAISIYQINDDRSGLEQKMDSLETEDVEPQGLIDKMIEYGVLDEGTQVLSFENTDGKGVLNLNQITSQEDPFEIRLVVESIVNTFTENFELEGGLILQENGQVYTIDSVEADEDGTMYYEDVYKRQVFYCLSIYFGRVGIRKTRFTLPGALLATAAGIGASIWLGGRLGA